MNMFPLLDPIPLPAPVWLFKALHILTLALHFVAVEILLGGLLMATALNALGRSNPVTRGAAVAMARRLPVVMTYVINLGVPPLLFAQVLYGPALYTTNALIGTFWFSVIFLLMACYWFLYQFTDGVMEGKSVWWKGLLAWILAGCISRILSTNMALMLKPEVWKDMYSSAAMGNHLPPYDPTLLPRWLFMICGAGWVCGLWMVWIASRKTVELPLKRFLSGVGGSLAAGMIMVAAVLYFLILQAQPDAVIKAINANIFFKGISLLWYALAMLIFIFALWLAVSKASNAVVGYIGLGLGVLSIASWTIVRDAIRDLTLYNKGFDVWQQTVVTNWQVVGVFFLVFVLGLGALVWLISVLMRAKPIAEGGV